jgi:hypothetical protein
MNRSVRFESTLAVGVLAGLLCGVSGCDGCGSNKPYTPFGVASAWPSAEPKASPAPELGNAGAGASNAFATRKAELVPAAPRTWQGAGLELSAPEGRGFAQVLPADFDQDQKADALAWLVPMPGDPSQSPGELWYFPSGAAARKLSALPSFVPSSPDCTLSTTLSQTGAQSATLDVSATCAALVSRTPARALVVVSPSVEHPILLTLRAASAAPDEAMNISIDSSDQDHDGRDDVRLTLSVAALGASEPASADLIWLDRAAGASRSASEPLASVLRFATQIALGARSKRGRTAIDRIASVRRLLSSLCAESGVARVFDEEGTPIRCGDLNRVLDSLVMSEVQACLADADPLGAFSVLARDGWYFQKLSSERRKAVDRELLRAVSKLELEPPLIVRARPTLPALPHYSPLWFEADGALLIQGAPGVTRLRADRASEEPVSAEGGVANWPLDLALSNGQRVLGAVHACDRSELFLNQSDPEHRLLPPLVTRVLAARPASCAGHGSGPNVPLAPISFDGNGLDALVAGSRVGLVPAGKKPVAGLPAIGAPRSPDGRWLVTPNQLGLLVLGDRKELWQTKQLPEHADATRFTDCVVANDARAVACIDSGRALLFERPRPGPSTPHQ